MIHDATLPSALESDIDIFSQDPTNDDLGEDYLMERTGVSGHNFFHFFLFFVQFV